MTGRGHVRTIVVAALLALSLGQAACASAAPRGRVYLRVGPPAPVVERRLVSPGPGFVWIPGFYRVERGAYLWVPGRWDPPPRARAVWVPARWVHDRRGGTSWKATGDKKARSRPELHHPVVATFGALARVGAEVRLRSRSDAESFCATRIVASATITGYHSHSRSAVSSTRDSVPQFRMKSIADMLGTNSPCSCG